MTKDILIVAHYTSDLESRWSIRFNYLAELLAENGLHVELVTSGFSHFRKRKRHGVVPDDHKYKITYIPEPGYSKNVSLKRLYSHIVMSHNLKQYLKDIHKPDIVYCAIPSLQVATVAAEYAKKNNIPFVIDVQDLWPEAFKMLFRVPFIKDMLFRPMEKRANYVYSLADQIIAVSKTYGGRAAASNSKCKEPLVVFLGTDLKTFDRLSLENKPAKKPEQEIWLAYVGTLGHSYDLTSVIDALKILKDKRITCIRFIVMGDGPLGRKFQKHAEAKGILTTFMGRIDYGKMSGILKECDIAVNPIAKGAAQSIINKHADYAAAGLPVLSTQECPEYQKLVNEYEMGFNCRNNDPKDLADKLMLLVQDKNLIKNMALNSRRLAEERFDRSRTYPEILTTIRKVLNKQPRS